MTKKNSLLQPRSISRTLLSLLPDIAANWMMTTIIVVAFVTFPTVIIYTDAAAADDYGTTYNNASCLPYEAVVLGDKYGAGTQRFCGTDGQFHFYNCRDFLAYGPESFTGISTTTNDRDDTTTSPAPPDLICSSYISADNNDNDGDDNNNNGVQNGVVYGCSTSSYMILDPAFGVSMPFNEKCSAQINEYTTFDCWQFNNKEGSTNFDSFLSEASNANLTSCTTTKDINFFYQTAYAHRNSMSVHNTMAGVDFNEDLARKNTMNSFLTVEQTTNATAAPTIDSSSSRHNNQMMVGNNMPTILLILAMKISYSLFIY